LSVTDRKIFECLINSQPELLFENGHLNEITKNKDHFLKRVKNQDEEHIEKIVWNQFAKQYYYKKLIDPIQIIASNFPNVTYNSNDDQFEFAYFRSSDKVQTIFFRSKILFSDQNRKTKRKMNQHVLNESLKTLIQKLFINLH